MIVWCLEMVNCCGTKGQKRVKNEKTVLEITEVRDCADQNSAKYQNNRVMVWEWMKVIKILSQGHKIQLQQPAVRPLSASSTKNSGPFLNFFFSFDTE